MATEKPRINITADPAMHRALAAAAKREGKPLATKAAELLALALEIEEDLLLGEIARQRLTGSVKLISHEDAWK